MHPMPKLFASSMRLLRFQLRQDWLKLMLWIAGISLFSIAVGYSLPGLFPTSAERQAIAETMRNPAMIAIIGPSGALDHYSIGAMFSHEMLLFTALAVAVMNIMLVTGHTRGDEEEGRLEMLRSMPVGKLAVLSATFMEMLLANGLLALIHGIGLGALGLESMSVAGSMLYGVSLGVVGIAFAASSALFAQLAASSRGAISLSLAFLGANYMLRAVTDVSAPEFSWLSPLAWGYLTEPYVKNSWLPALIGLLYCGGILSAAFRLNHLRDLGAGFLPQRGGRAHAKPSLLSPHGLALRLLKATLISWIIALFVIGITYGSVFGDLDSFFEGNESLELMLPKDSTYTLTEQFMSVLMVILAVAGTIPVLTAIFQLRGEEKKGRMDAIYAAAVSRKRMYFTYIAIGAGIGIVSMFASALGLYLAQAAVMETPIDLGTILLAALAYVPALLFMLSIGSLLVSALPRWTGIGWLYLVYCFIVDYMGGLLQLPEWMKKLTVFNHVPKLPVESLHWGPPLITAVLAAGICLAGAAFYRRRDIIENR